MHPKSFWASESNSTSTHTKLVYLDLSTNIIEYIKSGTFDPLINLLTLSLNNNRLSNIDNNFIVNMIKLNIFYIDNNELKKLPIKWLPPNLHQLYISGNEITYLSLHKFKGAFNLFKISLSLNNTFIEYNTFSKLARLTIELDHALLECTCQYVWYLFTDSNSVVCDDSNDKYASIREYLQEECNTMPLPIEPG